MGVVAVCAWLRQSQSSISFDIVNNNSNNNNVTTVNFYKDLIFFSKKYSELFTYILSVDINNNYFGYILLISSFDWYQNKEKSSDSCKNTELEGERADIWSLDSGSLAPRCMSFIITTYYYVSKYEYTPFMSFPVSVNLISSFIAFEMLTKFI